MQVSSWLLRFQPCSERLTIHLINSSGSSSVVRDVPMMAPGQAAVIDKSLVRSIVGHSLAALSPGTVQETVIAKLIEVALPK